MNEIIYGLIIILLISIIWAIEEEKELDIPLDRKVQMLISEGKITEQELSQLGVTKSNISKIDSITFGNVEAYISEKNRNRNAEIERETLEKIKSIPILGGLLHFLFKNVLLIFICLIVPLIGLKVHNKTSMR